MPKIRDYASEETLKAALTREGLDAWPYRVAPSEGTRVKPVFTLTVGANDDAETTARLTAEGFEWEAKDPTDEPVKPEDGSEDGGDWAEGDNPDRTAPVREHVQVINPHVSDLFFNYGHGDYTAVMSEEDPDHKTAREAIRADAEEFTEAVLGGFGIAINVDELVDDFFARV